MKYPEPRIWLLFQVSFLVFLLSSCQNLFSQGAGTALDFDGGNDQYSPNSDYVVIGDGQSGELDIGSGDFTICLWMKSDASRNSWSILLSKEYGQPSPPRTGYEIFIDPPPYHVFFQLWYSDTYYATGSQLSLADGKWHHVAAVTTPGGMQLFVDGTLREENSFSRPDIDTGYPLQMGLRPDLWFPYDGVLDEVSIFAAALEPSTIRDWMHKRVSADHPNFSDLHGYWRLNEGAGSSAGDSSSYGNHGVMYHMDATDWVTSTAPFSTNLTQYFSNVRAIWSSVNSNTSSILSLESAGLTGDASVVFGHDNGNLSPNVVNVPAGINRRLNRLWRVETQGTPTGDLIFDTSNLGITDGAALRLLVDADGDFSDATIISGAFANSKFTVAGHSFQNGYYYTLGSTIGDNPLPVTLTSFTARGEDGKVLLRWITESELNNDAFLLDRAIESENLQFSRIAEIAGHGNSTERHIYEFTDHFVVNGNTYYYRLSDRDLNGVVTYHSTISAIPTAAGELIVRDQGLPDHFRLYENYPNPFNLSTTIAFDLQDRNNSIYRVDLSIYNILGEKIISLFGGDLPAGGYQVRWDGTDEHNTPVETGLYIYRLVVAGQYTKTGKMILLK